MDNYTDFINYIKKEKNEKKINLFFDLETLQYNEEKGYQNPSLFKNSIFSLCVGWDESGEIKKVVYPDFFNFFNDVFKATMQVNGKCKCKATINLIAHNSNKYDNHFLLYDLLYYYKDIKRENLYLNSALDNTNTRKIKTITQKEKENGIILEKRVKSSNNLELLFWLKDVKFKTIDNWLKTSMSISALGKKMLKAGMVKEEELKTSFNYKKYNLDNDLLESEIKSYTYSVFEKLTKEELNYIENDVIILGKCFINYDKLFPNFSYDKITFTSNILESYNTNNLTSFQLLNLYGKDDDKIKINYTEYKIGNENLYDYYKSFYRGGLNFYNDKYLHTIISDLCFSMDINSSYPYVMDKYKVPTYLYNFKYFEKPQKIKIEDYNENFFTMYRMTKKDFNEYVLDEIESKVLRKMFVKYYTTNEFVNINTYTLKLIEDIIKIKFDYLPILSYVTYKCEYFGSRHKIEDYYYIKCQGKMKNKLDMNSPYNYKILDEINDNLFSDEEIYNSKVMINGLYGIPALRAYFNLFRTLPDNSLENIPNGYKNNERNIVFSIFVTAVSVYNLLTPLKYLTEFEIDDNLIYTDTDSLYLKNKIRHKIPKNMFDDIALGKWGIQENKGEFINKFFVLNHKKYCYQTTDGEFKVKCGGIDLNSFNKNMTFEKFVITQFSFGREIKNTKSIMNKQGTISIYESTTKLDVGKCYRMSFMESDEKKKEKLFEKIRNENKRGFSDIMYIESPLGNFSSQDIFPKKHNLKNKYDISFLLNTYKRVENLLKKEEV